VRVYRTTSEGRTEIAWRSLAGPQELADHVNKMTSDAYARVRWPEWWALRCSRRLPMEPWAQDLAAARALRKVLEQEGDLEVEEVSPTLPFLFTESERERIGFKDIPSLPRPGHVRRLILWVLKKLRNRLLLWRLPKPWRRMDRCDLLLHTVVLPDSISPEGRLNDMFFPEVQETAERQGKKAFTLGFAPMLPARVRHWKRAGDWALLDEVIGLREAIVVARKTFALRRRIQKWSEPIGELPAAWLRARWLDDLQQSEFFDSIAAAQWVGEFCSSRRVGTFLYSFERKTFEQAMLQAVHWESPGTQTCAYQNAALTNKHYHCWAYTNGADLVPGLILTVGDVTTDILRTRGRYPHERVRIGGALRQRTLLEREVLRRPFQNLLVIWAEGREQYEKFWSFLRKSWDQTDLSRFHFRIRLHPAIPFEFPDGEKYSARYEIDQLIDIRQSIDWADGILYASTSLAIIASASGIPVLSVRLPDYFDDDCIPPIGEMLHWRVGQPAGLVKVLEEIEAMYDEDFEARLKGSKQFAQSYFHRTTTEAFLRAAGVLTS
jgi:hypothetical protein